MHLWGGAEWCVIAKSGSGIKVGDELPGGCAVFWSLLSKQHGTPMAPLPPLSPATLLFRPIFMFSLIFFSRVSCLTRRSGRARGYSS